MNEKKVYSFEEMPGALSLLIQKVENLQNTVDHLSSKLEQKPADRWMSIEDLMEYIPSHPKKQTVYEWVSKRLIPYHKYQNAKELVFLQSEIDAYLMGGVRRNMDSLEDEARGYLDSRRKKG